MSASTTGGKSFVISGCVDVASTSSMSGCRTERDFSNMPAAWDESNRAKGGGDKGNKAPEALIDKERVVEGSDTGRENCPPRDGQRTTPTHE